MRRRHPRRVQEQEDTSSSSFEVDQDNDTDRNRSISVSSTHSRSSHEISTLPPPRRRKRKKRKSSSEKSKKVTVRQKISNIERALVHLEDEISESLSDEATDQVPKRFGRNQLRESAIGTEAEIPRLIQIYLTTPQELPWLSSNLKSSVEDKKKGLPDNESSAPSLRQWGIVIKMLNIPFYKSDK